MIDDDDAPRRGTHSTSRRSRQRTNRGIPLKVTTVALAGVVGALLVIPSAVAVAAVTSETVTACELSSGLLRRADSANDCKRSETPVEWNIQGPVGPQGVPGPEGRQGLHGLQGPQGEPAVLPPGTITSVEYVADSHDLIPGRYSGAGDEELPQYQASCQPGQTVVAGGFDLDVPSAGPLPGAVVDASGPMPDASGWTVAVATRHGGIQGTVMVHAVCADVVAD